MMTIVDSGVREMYKFYVKLINMTRDDPQCAKQVFLDNMLDGEHLEIVIYKCNSLIPTLDDKTLNQWTYWAVYYQCPCLTLFMWYHRPGTLTFFPQSCPFKRMTLHWMFIHGMEMTEINTLNAFNFVDLSKNVTIDPSTMFDAYGYTPFMYSALLDDVRHNFPLEVLAVVAKWLQQSAPVMDARDLVF